VPIKVVAKRDPIAVSLLVWRVLDRLPGAQNNSEAGKVFFILIVAAEAQFLGHLK